MNIFDRLGKIYLEIDNSYAGIETQYYNQRNNIGHGGLNLITLVTLETH